jgi:hypothetical protein
VVLSTVVLSAVVLSTVVLETDVLVPPVSVSSEVVDVLVPSSVVSVPAD